MHNRVITSDVTSDVRFFIFTRRFVGWITNFIHNRKDPDINMVRGYLTSTVGRSVKPERLEVIRQRSIARKGKDPTSGFLSRSSDVLDVLGETRQGSGQIAYKLHSRSHRKPLYTKRSLRTMRAKVDSFVTQMQVEEFVPPERVLSITSGISFNGKSWAKGTGCLFRQDDDPRSQTKPRAGQVVRVLVVEVNGEEEFFFQITEHKILRWQRSIAIVDLSSRTRTRVTHSSNVTALAAYAPYWQPAFTQYKCVTRVIDTY